MQNPNRPDPTPLPDFPPYPAYKPSGINWLGDIPAHWDVRRLKFSANTIMGQSPSGYDCAETPIGLPFLQGSAEFQELHPKPMLYCRAPKKISPKGAILLSVRAPVGRLNFADQEYAIGRGLCAIIPDNRNLDTTFAYYHLQAITAGLRMASTGSIYDAVSVGDVRGQPIITPPLSEQRAIAAYLDRIGDIARRYAHVSRRIIATLRELRQVEIQDAVTRGLNEDTPLKPSGIEWLGDVPSHWDVRRLRYVAQMRVSNVDKHIKLNESPVRLCNYVDVYYNDRISADLDFMRATATDREIERFRLERGDVIITKDSETWNDIGVPALVEYTDDDLICGYHLALLRPFKSVMTGDYLLRALQTPTIGAQFHIQANGVTRYGLKQNAIKSVHVPVPPIAEQRAIAAHLDARTALIDAAIAHYERMGELVAEYWTILVADAVTGRIDLRQTPVNAEQRTTNDAHS